MRTGILLVLFGAAAAAGEYAGSDACVRCHRRETEEWARSPHGRHATALATPDGGADAAVGSRWMQAYLRRGADGLHRVLPRCYDVRLEQWRDVGEVLAEIRGAPGTPAAAAADLRSFETDCAGCHASQAGFRFDASSGRIEGTWTELAIGCETCHGPGAAHAEAWGRLDPSVPMVRIERLSPRAQTAVCARCHGGPATAGDFGPADAALFVGALADRPGFFPDGTASGQVYQHAAFLRSPCHAEGRLACTGCHESHGPELRHREHGDALCTRCHEGYAARTHTFHDPRGEASRCVACHMPRLLGGLMAHQRDHRIASPLPASPHAPDACTACHEGKTKAWAAEARARLWGAPPPDTLAAIEAIAHARSGDPAAAPLLREALRHRDPFFRANAALYLRDGDAVRADPVPEVRLAGASVALAAGGGAWVLDDPEPRIRALALVARLERGVAATPEMMPALRAAARQLRDFTAAHVLCGSVSLADDRLAEAEARFAEALAFQPDRTAAWLGLARARAASGRTGEASAVLRAAMDRVPPGPGREDVRRALRELLTGSGVER